jgi:hypothetical protein
VAKAKRAKRIPKRGEPKQAPPTAVPSPADPTVAAYSELQFAYDEYNAKLFDGALPPCLITMHNTGRRSFGYFSLKRFQRLADGSTHTDEIAMNPRHFQTRTLAQVLSTLVHEQCHLWQHHFGNPSRASYHNREWANNMISIGLYPSTTGDPGGKETGQKMHHYIVAGGAFERVTEQLLANGFTLTWGQLPIEAPAEPVKRVAKYRCPTCAETVKGRPDIKVQCRQCDCDQLMVQA